MKKIVLVFLLIISLITLSGCKTGFEKNFIINKPYKIKEELQLEDVQDEIIEAINYYELEEKKTIKGNIIILKGLLTAETIYKEDRTEDNIKIEINTKATAFYVKSETMNIYVKDNMMYTDESKTVNDEKVITKKSEIYEGNINVKLPIFDNEMIMNETYQYGKDSKGRIIVQSEETNFRMVIKDKKIIFLGYKEESGSLLYFTFTYGKAKINYPDFSDYNN